MTLTSAQDELLDIERELVKLNAEIREHEVTHGVQESNSSSADGSGNDLGQEWSDGGHWEQDEVDDGKFSDSPAKENRS
jgi:hypothetical protein